MKALLEYHGFTKQVEVQDYQEVCEIHIPPTDPLYDMALQGNHRAMAIAMNSVMPMHHYLIFKRVAITEVDNEKIAIFELYEER